MAYQAPVTARDLDFQGQSLYGDSKKSRVLSMPVDTGNQYSADPVQRRDWLDPLDPMLTERLSSIQSIGSMVYGGEPLTTLSYKLSGTTSNWWLILAFNGYLHPDEIPVGVEIDIPNFAVAEKKKSSLEQRRLNTVTF
jgi:hypothetical protein